MDNGAALAAQFWEDFGAGEGEQDVAVEAAVQMWQATHEFVKAVDYQTSAQLAMNVMAYINVQ